MILALRRHQGQLPPCDDIYVPVDRLELATLGPLEKALLLPDKDDPVKDQPVGKIWLQDHAICILHPLGYNVSVVPGTTEEAWAWISYPTIHITLPRHWEAIVECNGINCRRQLLKMSE